MPSDIASAINPKNTDDDAEEEEKEKETILRELYWDRIVIYLSTAIIALAGLDILTELLRGGSGVICLIPSQLNATDNEIAFANSFCGQSVPVTQFLPIIVLGQGVLIGAWHFFWKSSFSNELHLFLSYAQDLDKFGDDVTGDYLPKNQVIVAKMVGEFSKYSRRGVFTWYQVKLFLQFFTTLGFFFFTLFFFTNFDVDFSCPDNVMDPSWPFPGTQVICILSTLSLFSVVRIFDLALLGLVVLTLIWGILWTFSKHCYVLGARNIALFAFNSGISGDLFVSYSAIRNPSVFYRNVFLKKGRIWRELKLRFFAPRIETDLDFLLTLLYRTDSSLGQSFREGQVRADCQTMEEMENDILLSGKECKY